MGNLQTGIKEEGSLENLMCKRCGEIFQGRVGVVTIKGPSPTPQFCDRCKINYVTEIRRFNNPDTKTNSTAI